MNENSAIDFFSNLDWTKPTEDLLISWADIALCYTWIFDKCFRRVNKLNYGYTIPIIVFSTITGTLSMSLDSLLSDDKVKTGQIVIGGINIFIGILSTLQNFYRYAQLSEANLVASRDWAKLHRNIKIELSIERRNRKSAGDFVRSTRQEYERLLNSRPIIPSSILMDFKNQYRNSDVIKPEVVEKIRHIILDDEKNIVSNFIPTANTKPSFFNRMSSFISKNIPFTPKNSQNSQNSQNSNVSNTSENAFFYNSNHTTPSGEIRSLTPSENILLKPTSSPPPTPINEEEEKEIFLTSENPIVLNLDKNDLVIKIHEE
jgi:hypothetical protein